MSDCIPDAGADYLQQRADHLRYLSREQAHADTEELDAIEDGLAAILCGTSLALSALAVLLFGMALGHQILLPTATIWPLCVAAAICTAAAAVSGKIGLSRL